MSLLSAHLDTRVVPGVPEDLAGPACATLADLRVGESATIVGFDPSLVPATARRLFDLGFAVGAPVHAVRRAPLRDPIVYSVAHYEIALRRAEAASIRVQRAG